VHDGFVLGRGVGVGFATYMIGISVIQPQLAGQPFGQGREAAAQHGHAEAQAPQGLAQLSRAGRDGDGGFEPLEDVRGHAFQQGDACAERFGEVELAVHCARGDGL